MEIIFENRKQIEALIQRADNFEQTKQLTKKFNQLKSARKDFYLTLEEIEDIFKWKLRTQYYRQVKKRSSNTDSNIIRITRTAFAVTHPDNDYEIQLKLKLLTTISGVGIPVASAILTLCYPESYAVIDFRNWNQIYKSENRKIGFTPTEYTEYLKIIRKLSELFELTPQQIDIAIWQKNKDQNLDTQQLP